MNERSLSVEAGSGGTWTEPPATFDGFREALSGRFDQLSPHLRRLARVALEDPNGVAFGTVATFARQAAVQPSSVLRFARTFGYGGFPALQRVFRERLVEGPPERRAGILEEREQRAPSGEADHGTVLAELVALNHETLDRLQEEVTPQQLAAGIALIKQARDVFVMGQRRGFPFAAYLAYGLIRSERRCQLLDGVGGMIPQQLAARGSEDLLIAISFQEYAALTVQVVQDAVIRGIPVLAITDSELSPLTRGAAVSLILRDVVRGPFRPAAAMMCLIQALVVGALDPLPLPSAPPAGAGTG